MPEGDMVWRLARTLDRALTGHPLTRTDFRVPRLATVDLRGAVVAGTMARGKHLLTRIGETHTLHTHLKMEGVWQVHPVGSRWRRPTHQARVVLATAETEAVGFSLGLVELLRRDAEEAALAHLGPDLLGPDWHGEEAVRRLLEEPGRGLYEALLDQTNLAGLGNVYAAEVCFLAGVRPDRPVGEIAELAALVERARAVLEANRGRVEMITTGDPRRGRRTWVYRQRECRRCGTRVRVGQRGAPGRERTAYWCPRCQQ